MRPIAQRRINDVHSADGFGTPADAPSSTQEWYRALAASSRDIVSVRDLDGLLTYVSPSVFASLGYRADELEGTNERDLIHPQDLATRDTLALRLLESTSAQPPAELRMRSKSGAWRWFESIDTNYLDNASVQGIVSNALDISERKAAEAELIETTLRDDLTGLPNRLLLTDRLAVALARTARADDVMAVLFCDLDEFKVINDSVGHRGGDRVLIEVARRFQQALRQADTVGRPGGDEFVVVCEGLHDAEDATKIANNIRSAVEQPIVFDEFEAAVSVSIGIVTVPGAAASGADPMLLLRNADAAMYRAKRDGKARWALFDESLIRDANHRRELDCELRRAVTADELVVHYQPIYDLGDETVVGVEALVRWNNPTRGLLQPDSFIPLAEDTGLILEIGEWVLREACGQLADWRREFDWPGWMSVNLSPYQLSHPGLSITIREALGISGLPAGSLRLELTESALLGTRNAAAIELHAIRALGVRIGMDDFGTGYASLLNLDQLPIDFLKIDRGFVAALTARSVETSHGNAIVAAISQIGRTLDLETIAEGIETAEQEALLREYGCPYGQGYLFARPAPADEIAGRLTARVDTGTRPG